MGNSGSRETDREKETDQENDRVFMMVGRAGVGKSTLGNLIFGEKLFKACDEIHSYSTTRTVESFQRSLTPETIFGRGLAGIDKINIKVIDQPGMDDAEYKITDHCSNLKTCLTNLNVKTFATFLLVINLQSDVLTEDRCLLITQLSELLTRASYSFFTHAIVVFTHADELDCDVNNREELNKFVQRKCQLPGFQQLPEILQAVNERFIFVNGTETNRAYRHRFLKLLFEFSKSTLHIRFHGNNNFTSALLKRKLGVVVDGIVEEEMYKLDYQFHPDLNLFWMDEVRDNLENQFQRAIQSMIDIGEGVSAMVLLISLVNPMSEQMEKLILDLPECYCSEGDEESDKIVKQFWRQSCIVFKVYNEVNAKTSIQTNIDNNPRIKNFVSKVNNKWTWITNDTPESICRERMSEMCLAVRKDVGGKEFIQNTVIKELEGQIKQIRQYTGINTQISKFKPEFHKKMAGAINCIQSGDSMILKVGGIPLKHKISIRSMRLILKSTLLSTEEMVRFKAKYKNPDEKVSIQEILEFLADIPPNS